MFQNGSACFRLHVGHTAGERGWGGEGEGRGKGLTTTPPPLLLHTEDAKSSQNTHTFNKSQAHKPVQACFNFVELPEEKSALSKALFTGEK